MSARQSPLHAEHVALGATLVDFAGWDMPVRYSGDIAEQLGRTVTSLAPTRSALIDKGMIWSPNHGDTAFTVPLFDEFMRRIMPGGDWKATGG